MSQYLNRSVRFALDGTSRVLRMAGADAPQRTPKTLLTFNSRADLEQLALGCDADIGGTSSVHMDLDEAHRYDGRPTGKFWGDMRLAVRKELEGRVRGGYAGFRNKHRPTLFGEITEDVTFHEYLALRVRAAGDPRTRHSYYVNLQMDGPITTDIWQHRLFFNRDDGAWEDLYIPFDDFVLTNAGEVASKEMTMARDKVRSIGISLLGGNSGVEGPYELGIDSIRAVNAEDVTIPKRE
ncbi:CIA30-domain-containing protein [Gloeophyllum trabeum ATCC 11539]|uniref:CIA30-domain-containing protein n=1 Tax=Gloeophyllum trabeum (strain ATCC 11539 / FP-39264 / Madison 617) TaxID=670483 RepID=S7PYZ3_GLOTA|nr:CIA30-domain-containing protein [Gloeophyllum trabeum ATCC 11539]EPQ52693.1 CIA30-domain-containing protein [Gloeophyllum trabeum ATCC 11539]